MEVIGTFARYDSAKSFGEKTTKWGVTQTEADLERLSEYAVESRYPGDLPEITSTEAKQATADARRLFDAAQHNVNIRLSDDSLTDE